MDTITTRGGFPGGSGDQATQDILRLLNDDLARLFEERKDVMLRIAIVRKTIIGLGVIFGESVLTTEVHPLLAHNKKRHLGFTKACREVLSSSDHALSAREVVERMCEACPELLTCHRDPLASVTAALNRMVDYGEARRIALPHNRSAWEWAGKRQERVESMGGPGSQNA